MVYLLLAMISSMLVSVVMRISEKYSRNNLSLLAMNYLMCTLMGALMTGSIELFPANEGLPLTIGFGVFSGMLYLGSFIFYQWNIRKNGVVLPATFMKLGVVVPTVLAIVAFGEQPRALQVVGIVAAIVAILLLQGGGKGETRSAAALVLLMLAGGSTDATSKVFEQLGPAELKPHFLLYTFGIAFVLCVALCIWKKQRLTAADALFGLAIGVPNYFSSWFLLLSLDKVPAMIAYPSYSVGTIVLVAVFGILCFKERLSRRKAIALGMILVALAMLNM